MILWNIPEKINSQYLTAGIALNLGTAHYHKEKDSDSLLLISDYTIFFYDTGGPNPQLNEEELYMIIVAITREARKWLYIPKNIYIEFKLLRSYMDENDSEVTPVNDKCGLGQKIMVLKPLLWERGPKGGWAGVSDGGRMPVPDSQLRLPPE